MKEAHSKKVAVMTQEVSSQQELVQWNKLANQQLSLDIINHKADHEQKVVELSQQFSKEKQEEKNQREKLQGDLEE